MLPVPSEELAFAQLRTRVFMNPSQPTHWYLESFPVNLVPSHEPQSERQNNKGAELVLLRARRAWAENPSHLIPIAFMNFWVFCFGLTLGKIQPNLVSEVDEDTL